MRCRKCGAELAPGVKFCRECGEKVQEEIKGPKFCRECGEKLEAGAKFCPNCGTKVVNLNQTDTAPEIPFSGTPGPNGQQEKPAAVPAAESKKEMQPEGIQNNSGVNTQSVFQVPAAPSKGPESKAAEMLKNSTKSAWKKFSAWWLSLRKISRLMIILVLVLAVFALAAFCAGKIASGIIGVVQIELVMVSWLMLIGKIKGADRKLPVCLTIAALAMALLYFGTLVPNDSESPAESPQNLETEAIGTTYQDSIPEETKETEATAATTATEVTEAIAETEPPAVLQSPEMYYGTWAFASLEMDGERLTNELLMEHGDDSLNSYRIVFREDGTGSIFEQSGITDFQWKMSPHGIISGSITASVADDVLCMVDQDRKMYLEKISDDQNTPELYQEETESTTASTMETVRQTVATEPQETTVETTAEPTTVPTEAPTIPTEAQKIEVESDKVYYSTNNSQTVRNGNTGVYAYKSRGGSYDRYYIIDFNADRVYYFVDGNGDTSCDSVKIESGCLNDVLIITYHDGGTEWSYGLHFKYKDSPEHLILQDNDGFEYDFYPTDLASAEHIKSGRSIHNY